HLVSLSWVDHDHWSGGVCPPSKVVETLLEVLLDDPPVGGIPRRFDASSIRRLMPAIDESVRARL
ncbi:MAG: hypothetical protein KDA28_07600, partial [Phycisphaerales bacterium]|nr:hypothetical protein [Phycisphaerales bacterium]